MKKLISFMKQDRHDPVIAGLYETDMSSAYFPKKELEKILPKGMSIPSDEIMSEKFPTVKKIEGMHPFLLQASTGSNVRPPQVNIYTPPYEEIMFYFPVIYTHGNEQQLCSYVPVLYLNFLFGVIFGNWYWKFRKEYKPRMKIEKSDAGRNYTVKDIISMNFNRTSGNNKMELDPFFVQMYKNPTLLVSNSNKTLFYTTEVFSITKVLDISPVYEWNYKGSVIRNNEYTFGHYSEFTFSISKIMDYDTCFHPTG